jgi:hypothetical protein
MTTQQQLADHTIKTSHDTYDVVVIEHSGKHFASIELDRKVRTNDALAELIEFMGGNEWFPYPPHALHENPGLTFRRKN